MNVTVCEILRLYARMPRALAFVALAVSSIFVAARAHTPEYAFHAWLAVAASVATVFAIVNRC